MDVAQRCHRVESFRLNFLPALHTRACQLDQALSVALALGGYQYIVGQA